MSTFKDTALDPAIIERLRRGDRKAQEIVYRAYASPVFTLARRMLGEDGLAEEATQDAFVQVLTRAETLERTEALGAWIRHIAVNQCLMRLRSPWHRRREALDADEMTVEPELTPGDDNPGTAIDIGRALDQLAPTARVVVWLYCVEGYTHREIGDSLGKTASFSKSQLARALKALASHYDSRGARSPMRRTRAKACTASRPTVRQSSRPGTNKPTRRVCEEIQIQDHGRTRPTYI